MATDIDGVLDHADEGRRDFLRKLIRGAAFAPPLLASFSLQGLLARPAEGLVTIEYLVLGTFVGNQCLVSNQSAFVPTFDFDGTQYQDHFVDVLRPDDITAGNDLGGTGHPALNIRGLTGSGGSTWATVLDSLPHPTLPPPEEIPAVFRNGQMMVLEADFLIHPFNNTKGVGLLAFAFELVGDKGLALVVSNAGNTDRLQLITVEEATGKAIVLRNVSLGAGIAEDAWYRLVLTIQPGLCSGFAPSTCEMHLQGRVFRHQDPKNPNSGLHVPVGGAIDVQQSLSFTNFNAGSQVGIVARAVSAVVDSSVTNFTVRCGFPT